MRTPVGKQRVFNADDDAFYHRTGKKRPRPSLVAETAAEIEAGAIAVSSPLRSQGRGVRLWLRFLCESTPFALWTHDKLKRRFIPSMWSCV